MHPGPIHATLYTANGCRKYLNAAERERFLHAAAGEPPAIYALCQTLVFTGCRISEALALTPRGFDTEAGFIAIRSLKKRSRSIVVREVPVPTAMLDDVDRVFHLAEHCPTDRLWRMSRITAWALIKTIMHKAAIPPGPHMTPKGLRHAFGLHAIRCGVPLNLVQRWLGHASITTTSIYLQALGPEERELAGRMW